MPAMRGVILLIGILATLTGLVWVGQGTGYFPYPANSMMISQMPWTYRGIALAIAGVIGIIISRRMPKAR
jgi:ABC-type antimicrobial peptide transport system permease subunit